MKRLFVILLLSGFLMPLYSQSAKDIFTTSKMTWYGLDFSNVKLLGAAHFSNPKEIRDYYFEAINNVVVTEKSKYDLAEFFRKSEVNYNLSVVKARNAELDIEKALSDNPSDINFLNNELIEEIIKEYKCGSDEGLGVVFIIETLSKLIDIGEATMFVTFFDISTKTVLLTYRMTGRAKGFGFRNYWVRSVFSVLKDIDDKYSYLNDAYNK
ncbi:MAG: hypothetical protein NTX22_11180 [Ignavibacteriales bacterium]|nr:hypothetical protein [Ignavibacteriales bacterium]